MEPTEDVKNQVLLDQDCMQNLAGSSCPITHNIICEPVPIESRSTSTPSGAGQPQMKWKNAFGFVYQVRKKLSNQPHVYNDFIDIMRKVHNRSIETAEVVAVISDLFKDHPDLIRGFNAFLPDKHKIDVKVQLRVAVSGIPSPDSPSGDPNEREELPITTRIIKFTLNVRKRFEDDEKRPEKYKRFVEVLYLYKALSQQLQGLRKCKKKLKEEEVYAEVRKLFENNEDLLQEFSEYLPYNKKLSDIYKDSFKYCNDDAPYNCSCCSDVSSSGQTDVGKERTVEKRDSNRPHDEVTSSDDPGRFHLDNGISFDPIGVKDVKKFDVSSTHFNVKSELMETAEFNENNFIGVSRDGLEETIDCISKKDNIIKCFKSELKEETCEDERENYSEYIDFSKNPITIRGISHGFDKPLNNIEKSFIQTKKENFVTCDENESYFEAFNSQNDIKTESETEKIRTPRKPLTPFKVPFPPSNKLPQTIKRIVEEEYSPLPATKRAAVRQAVSRSPSPPDPDMETSVITRLAKRAALGSPEEENVPEEECTSPQRPMSCGSPNSPSAPKSSSDRRLRNLRKRLRRLANL